MSSHYSIASIKKNKPLHPLRFVLKYISMIVRKFLLYTVSVILLITSCNDKKQEQASFTVHHADSTGLTFTNTITPTSDFNMFTYMYFYNGAGVGAGDFNQDGKIDLFFAANQQQNKLYLNEGNLKFKDVTTAAGIPTTLGWHTGVAVADVNNDGLLDIYISRVSEFEMLTGHNELLICMGIENGIPKYKEDAAAYGLDFSGFSTQAAFFDYDMDGDLDCYLLNHSVHQNGTFARRDLFKGSYHKQSGDKLFRNDASFAEGEKNKNFFTDVTKESGIESTAIGYGLGICVSDINMDGWPDIYIGNDFHENDYLYINNKNGSFTESAQTALMHTSQYTMGVDIADANNDAYPDIVSMDMLPADPYILKRSLGEDPYDLYYQKIGFGYGYQYTRNNLQLNNGNGSFSETGLYSGIAATDWSWATLWLDFDNDGLKDLFISNGIPKRLNDIDYVNFVANDTIQQKIREQNVEEKYLALTGRYPEIKLPNYFFHNAGNMQFDNWHAQIKNDMPSFSNGAVYADFDNDGDLDIVTNNIGDAAMLYENNTSDTNFSVQLHLKGAPLNSQACGAKLLAYKNNQLQWYEKTATRGFLGSMEIPLHAAFGSNKPDSIFLIWPSNQYQRIAIDSNRFQTYTYNPSLPFFDFNSLHTPAAFHSPKAIDITVQTGLIFKHEEDLFNEFNRETLMPHMLTSEGPALAIGDVNNDGLDDVFIGGAKWTSRSLWIQKSNGTFIQQQVPALFNDSTYEDVDAVIADIDNDGLKDIIIASGGNEYTGRSKELQSRIYKNRGKGSFERVHSIFDTIFCNASSIAVMDWNGDGANDLFLGGRSIPWEYGAIPQSYLLENNGKGQFKNVTVQKAPGLIQVGLVTGACCADIDADKDTDLILSTEWGPIIIFKNEAEKFIQTNATNQKGWWNGVEAMDVDSDGDIDLVCGNLGLNSRLKSNENEPVRMYYADFDNNGKKEQLLTYYLNHTEIPFANKDELQKQLPMLKKKFLYAEDFAKAKLTDLFDKSSLQKAAKFTADFFENAVLLNDGKGVFTIQALPWQCQLSPLQCAAIIPDTTHKKTWLLSAGNFYENNIEMGRYDAGYGNMTNLQNNISTEPLRNVLIKGQARKILPININHKPAYIIARNNATMMVVAFE